MRSQVVRFCPIMVLPLRMLSVSQPTTTNRSSCQVISLSRRHTALTTPGLIVAAPEKIDGRGPVIAGAPFNLKRG